MPAEAPLPPAIARPGERPEPAALRLNRYFESRDVDDTRERISAVLQPHQLEPTGRVRRIRSHMDCIRFGGTVIGALDFGDEMDVVVDEMEGYYLFVYSLRGHADVQAMGECVSIGQSRGAVCIPGERFAGRFSSDCEQFFLRVDRATLTAHTGVDLMRFDPRLDLGRPELAPWLHQFRLLAGQPELIDLAHRDDRIAIELERLLISLLLAGQPHRPADRADPVGIAPVVVRRAEAWIEAHACEPIRLADIAAAVGVPVRTLLDGFHRFRGIGPMRSVRERRLDEARRRLLTGEPRVADVALDCGFAHLGRFSRTYRDRFGENPSDTLRRGGGGL